MDGFFDKYGRVIIIAVAICFVLLYLTPMRNVVGSSINGFAGNFANKVGESIGTVKMPDGSESGGKFTVPEGMQGSSILEIEGTQYIVLEKQGNNQALIMTVNSIGNRMFQSTTRPQDWQNMNTYEGSEVDKYLENDWYNSLSSTMKSAIQPTNIKQDSYRRGAISITKLETGYDGQVFNTINRNAFLPSVAEIGKVVDLKNEDKVKAFLNGDSIWTRDSNGKDAVSAMYLSNKFGDVDSEGVYMESYGVRPAFVVDLTKVQSEIVDTVSYK